MDGTAKPHSALRGAVAPVVRRAGRRCLRLGPAGSVRAEAGARAAVVVISLVLSLGLTGVLHVVLAVAG